MYKYTQTQLLLQSVHCALISLIINNHANYAALKLFRGHSGVK